MCSVSVRILCIVLIVGLAGGCRKRATEADVNNGSPSSTRSEQGYPEPRWPSYFKPPASIEDLMPAARALVRNKSGFLGVGMGVLQAGEQVLVVPNITSDPMVVEAVVRALAERSVTAHVRYTYELLGQTRGEAQRLEEKEHRGRNIADAGIYQASTWITGQFPNPAVPKQWLKERRPDLYAELFPGESGQPAGAAADESGEPLSFAREMALVGTAIQGYLKQNPKVRGAFWGTAGGTGLRRAMYPMQEKFLGTFTTDNIWTMQSQMTNYPGDVWQLAEEQILEPLVYADRLEITDPEGTNVWSDLTPDMAERWSQGAYQRGHLYMFPNQATGRFGYSFVNYPGFQQKWLPREPIALINGVIAGTQGHGGFYPRWEVSFKDGFIADVKGGGAQGAALKEFLKYPGLNDRLYPYHKTPGFWYLYEIAVGTHPKAFRAPQPILESGDTLPERARSGVVHWGLGIRLWHDPDAPTESKVWADFTKKHNVPFDHGWHTHTYFTTYKLRLRNANKWVTLLEKGRMTSLDHPEVRALASRYGDPDYLLTEDWVPEVPGINAPGDYLKDYASRPGDYALKVLDKAGKGTYDRYFPVTSPRGATKSPPR